VLQRVRSVRSVRACDVDDTVADGEVPDGEVPDGEEKDDEDHGTLQHILRAADDGH
jgi:hypothetical protein